MLGWLLGRANDLIRPRSARTGTTAADPVARAQSDSLDYIHDQVVRQIDIQLDAWNSVDDRLRFVLGVVSVVVAVAASFFQRPPDLDARTLLPWWVGLLVIGSIAVLLMAAAIAGLGLFQRGFDRPPLPGALGAFVDQDVRTTRNAVRLVITAAYARNERLMERKIQAFRWSFVVATIGVFLLGFAVMGYISTQTASMPSMTPPAVSPTPSADLNVEGRS